MAEKNTVYFVVGGSAIAVGLILFCMRRGASAPAASQEEEPQPDQTIPAYLGYNTPIKFDTIGFPTGNSNITFGDIVINSDGPMLPVINNKGACCGGGGSRGTTISSRPIVAPEVKPYQSTYVAPSQPESKPAPKAVDYYSCNPAALYAAVNEYAQLTGYKNAEDLLVAVQDLRRPAPLSKGTQGQMYLPIGMDTVCDVLRTGVSFPTNKNYRTVKPGAVIDGNFLRELYAKHWTASYG